ncbi:MAG: hypothetical protein ACM3MA_02920 [Acidobacteriota bacterium]
MSIDTMSSQGLRPELNQPNCIARRVVAGVGAVAFAALAIAGGTHRETVAVERVHVPGDVDVDAARFPGDITIDAVCDATKQLVDKADLPAGVTDYDKTILKDSCTHTARDLIELNGDVTGEDVVVKLQKDIFSNYYVTADTLEENS